MADEKVHPLALGGKRPEPTRKGRPRKDGARYPSGQLKPPPPNARVLADRAAICDDPSMASCPLDAAYANGWISKHEYGAGNAYIAVHARAGLMSPGATTGRDTSLPSGAELDLRHRWSDMSDQDIRRLKITHLSNKDLVLIWDSAMRDMGRSADPEKAEQFAADSNRRWRALNAAMTAIERVTVDSFCIREVWPQWFWERRKGVMDSRWEDGRDILISGLRAMARALEKPKTIAIRDLAAPPPPRRSTLAGPRLVEAVRYVDEEGQVVLEVERIKRRGPE